MDWVDHDPVACIGAHGEESLGNKNVRKSDHLSNHHMFKEFPAAWVY